ncbi:uncharacterized protein [Montipora capricornis]|uniref:uncharacterized protein n=1 Tax=Montipora capricornis TaxID=246305 RepID=UPI0035F13E2F
MLNFSSPALVVLHINPFKVQSWSCRGERGAAYSVGMGIMLRTTSYPFLWHLLAIMQLHLITRGLYLIPLGHINQCRITHARTNTECHWKGKPLYCIVNISQHMDLPSECHAGYHFGILTNSFPLQACAPWMIS